MGRNKRRENGMNLIEIIRDGEATPAIDPLMALQEDDRLVFAGDVDMVTQLQRDKGLSPVMDRIFEIDTTRPDRCFVKAVVSKSNRLIGRSLVGGHFRQIYDAVVVAVSRGGNQIKGTIGNIVLQEGDTLLLETHPSFYMRHRRSQHFHLISQLEDSSAPRHSKALFSIAVLLASEMPCKKRALPSLVAGNPWLVLSMLYLTTSILTEMVTNNAAALILFPIAMAMAVPLRSNHHR
jgi:K+/H+ antiporter YhaU regulatory subunit KhtT